MVKGHARQRGKGKWQLEVDLGFTIDPETNKKKRVKKYRTVKAKNQKEADLLLARFVIEVTDESYYEPEKMMFEDFVMNEWLPKHAEKHLAHTTLETHKIYLKARILPAFRLFRVDQIKPLHILDFLHNLGEDGMRLDGKEGKLSSSSIFYHYRILNNIFNFAVKLRIIKDSPVKDVEKPKIDYKEVEVYSLEETSHLLKCLESETDMPHWQIIIKLAITTGMRRSELMGLEFKHFDFDKRIVKVEQALTYSKSKGYQIHEIKKGNRTSNRREIIISESLIEPIKRLHLQRKKERFGNKNLWMDGKHEFVLANENGKPFHPQSIRNWWIRFIERHELKYINIHALRHTSATLLINEGIHAKIISERLGHADIKTTMNVYGHALREADQVASDKLDLALSRAK